MISIRDIRIDPASIGKIKLLVDVVPVHEYREKQRTDNILGYRYVVALPQLAYEKLGVRIDGPQLLDKPESAVEVEFSGLELGAYESQGHTMISAKATGIALASAAKQPR